MQVAVTGTPAIKTYEHVVIYKEGVHMNQDNRRLQQIQEFKTAYTYELERAETVADCITIQNYIDDLEKEEKQILERNGVQI